MYYIYKTSKGIGKNSRSVYEVYSDVDELWRFTASFDTLEEAAAVSRYLNNAVMDSDEILIAKNAIRKVDSKSEK